MAGLERDQDEFAVARRGFVGAPAGVLVQCSATGSGVTALNENIWRKPGCVGGQGAGSELDDKIHGGQRGNNLGALSGRGNRTTHRLCVRQMRAGWIDAGFDSHHDDVTVGARLLQQADVTRMQEIERTACEDDTPAVAFPVRATQNQFILRNHAAHALLSSSLHRFHANNQF